MQFQQNQSTVRSLIPRGTQIGFVVGLLLGILLGWLFSGVVGAVMRFGFVAIALLIFMAALLFWWNIRRAQSHDGATVVTWSTSGLPPLQDDLFRGTAAPRQGLRDQDVIDLEQLKEQIEREKRS